MSVNPIGCSPMVAANRPRHKGCVQGLNKAAHLFNAHLKSLVDVIKPHLPDSNFVYVNSYKIIRDIIRNPISKGFKDASRPCCEVASINGVLCKRGGQACVDRSSHVFFDGLHPTEAVNIQIAAKAYESDLKSEVYPTNLSGDNGNTNFLDTKAKADYLPHGIDLPNGTSGRFTNGKNVVDFLSW
ncbi:gdsl esterase/lipase [Quercus suber]|uniref:Gdsl esterase/lipase n=1 Tax=Quercus suber TaxID=58331 RepID=A0AAW0L8N3_QUESU